MTALMLIFWLVLGMMELASFRLSIPPPVHCRLLIIGQHWKK